MEKVMILQGIDNILRAYGENEAGAIQKLVELRAKLATNIQEDDYSSTPSDKKKLAAIKRIINKIDESRPALKGYGVLPDGRTAITDSYQLYILNDKVLPYRVSFNNEISPEEQKEYLETYNKKVDYCMMSYPNIKAVIPTDDPLDVIEIPVKEVIGLSKTIAKDGTGKKIHTINTKAGDISFQIDYLKNIVDILKLKDKVELKIYGPYRPLIAENEDKEIGLMLPIKTY